MFWFVISCARLREIYDTPVKMVWIGKMHWKQGKSSNKHDIWGINELLCSSGVQLCNFQEEINRNVKNMLIITSESKGVVEILTSRGVDRYPTWHIFSLISMFYNDQNFKSWGQVFMTSRNLSKKNQLKTILWNVTNFQTQILTLLQLIRKRKDF